MVPAGTFISMCASRVDRNPPRSGRIILLARKLDQGGSERQLVVLAKEMKKRGHDVHVVLFYEGGSFEGELVNAGVPMHHAGKHGRWDVIGFGVRLAFILRRLRPTTIYSFLDLPNILAALLHRWIGRPRLVWSIRAAGMEMQHYDWLFRLMMVLEESMGSTVDAIVANSQAGKDWAVARGFPHHKVVVIENGIDTDYFQYDSRGRERVRAEWKVVNNATKLVGIVARLDPMKGHEIFLKAAAQLVGVRRDLMFVCVGGGKDDYLHRLEELARSLGIDQHVVWAGARTDMPAVFSALDVVVSSSSSEGFSNAIAEAMSCERPCVVTDVGDSARIVGEIGIVVPPGDVDALAGAISGMLDRIEKGVDIGRRARVRILDEFSVERMVSRTERVLLGG